MTKLVFSLLFTAACVQQAADPKPEMPTTDDARAVLVDNADLFHHILENGGQDPTQTLTPGRPLPVIVVAASELAAFDGKRDLGFLFHTTRERWFPLFDRAGVAFGSITLQADAGRWTMVRAGAPHLTRAIIAARAALPAGADEVGLVRIRELGVDFLAVTHGDELVLLPLYDNRELNLRARTLQPATALLAQLAPAAGALRVTSR